MTRKRRVGRLAALPAGAIGVKEKPRSGRLLIVVVGTVVGLVAMATPATAATGTGGGVVNIPLHAHATQTSPPCAQLHQHTWDPVAYVGTYQAGTASYTGPIRPSVDVTAWENPVGSYSSNACSVPGPVAITSAAAASTAPDPVTGWSVSCSWTQGTYLRLGTAYTYQLSDGTCTFTKGTTTVSSRTNETRVGEQVTCDPGMPPPRCTVAFNYEATNSPLP